MKTVFVSLLACLLACSASAQNSHTSWYHFAEEFYFVKEVRVNEFAGKNFRYEIAVHADPTDSLSKVRIHGIGAGKGKEDFLNSHFTVETRQEQEWTIYTVIGTVQPEAFRLWFYASVNGNGNFYFDDISFYIEDQPGHWQQLRLFNHSFEEDTRNIFAGYYVSIRKSPGIKTQLSKLVTKTGKHSLQVSASRALPAPAISTAHND